MRRTRTLAVAIRVIHQFQRDRRTLALLFVVPSLIILLLGWILKTPPGAVSLGLVMERPADPALSRGMESAAQLLARSLEEGGQFSVKMLDEKEQVEDKLRQGEIQGALILSGITGDSSGRPPVPKITMFLEGSSPQTSGRIQAGISRSLAQVMIPGGLSPKVDLQYLYAGPQYDVTDFFAPAFIAFFAFFLVFLLTVVSFLRERAQGTLERLMASPIARSELIVGYMLGFGLFAMLQSLVVVLITVFVLQIHYAGSLLIVFLIVGVSTAGGVNLGIFLSTFARTELQAIQFIPIVITPQVLLSGFVFPVDDLPEILQWLSFFMPLTYANNALRDVMIRGKGLADGAVLLNILVLVAFAALALVLGTLTLRRQVA